jgi:hypothetical protein
VSGKGGRGLHNKGRVRSRKALRDEMLDLALGLVRSRAKQLLVAVLGQMVAQEQERRQMNLSPLDHRQRDWEPADDASGADATARFVLAHTEPANAEVEAARAGRFEIERSLFDLAQMGQKTRQDPVAFAGERAQS